MCSRSSSSSTPTTTARTRRTVWSGARRRWRSAGGGAAPQAGAARAESLIARFPGYPSTSLASSSMRIIAGSLKGRRLESPAWEGLRPTSDKLRETLFNVLAPRTPGARVLDGYAGTGALGIEALSRGAAHVVFVERDRRACALIRQNLERCGIGGGYA